MLTADMVRARRRGNTLTLVPLASTEAALRDALTGLLNRKSLDDAFYSAVLEELDLTAVAANGYGFQIEMKYRAHRRGFVLRELPIVFPDRARGASKMTPGIAAEALRLVWRLRRAA